MKILITGTSQGIGLKLTEIAIQKKYEVFAVARKPSPELKELKKKYPDHLNILEAELTTDIDQIVIKVSSHESLDLLINNAGVYNGDTEMSDFLKTFEINSVIPLFLTRAVVPLLKKSKNPKVIHVTSLMGSIADNTSGGSYSYRASKAALNMINKSLTCDEPWLKTLVIHPGWVQTRMGGENAPLKVETSAAGIWQQIEKLEHSGHFLDYRGRELAW